MYIVFIVFEGSILRRLYFSLSTDLRYFLSRVMLKLGIRDNWTTLPNATFSSSCRWEVAIIYPVIGTSPSSFQRMYDWMAITFLKCCSYVIWSWNRAISSWTDVTFSLLLHLRKPDIPVTSSMQQETKYRSLLALSSTFSGHPRNPRHNGRWFRLTEQAKAERFPYYSYPLCGRLIHIQSLLWLVTLARVRLSGSAGRYVIQCLVIVSDGTVRLWTLDGASHHIPLISVVISHGERCVASPEMAKWQGVLLRRRPSSPMPRSVMSSWQSCRAECGWWIRMSISPWVWWIRMSLSRPQASEWLQDAGGILPRQQLSDLHVRDRGAHGVHQLTRWPDRAKHHTGGRASALQWVPGTVTSLPSTILRSSRIDIMASPGFAEWRYAKYPERRTCPECH